MKDDFPPTDSPPPESAIILFVSDRRFLLSGNPSLFERFFVIPFSNLALAFLFYLDLAGSLSTPQASRFPKR